jgi:hypothetical protein
MCKINQLRIKALTLAKTKDAMTNLLSKIHHYKIMGQTPFTTKIGGILSFILHTQACRGNFHWSINYSKKF